MHEAQLPPITDFSWQDVERACSLVVRWIANQRRQLDMLVAIERGGCIPGVILAHRLAMEGFMTLSVRTTSTDVPYAPRRADGPQVDEGPLHLDGQAVLLVDDVTNTGTTLRVARERLGRAGCHEVVTAVLAWDCWGGHSLEADYAARHTDGWVRFPWEREPSRSS